MYWHKLFIVLLCSKRLPKKAVEDYELKKLERFPSLKGHTKILRAVSVENHVSIQLPRLDVPVCVRDALPKKAVEDYEPKELEERVLLSKVIRRF